MRNVVKEVRLRDEEQRSGAWYTTKNRSRRANPLIQILGLMFISSRTMGLFELYCPYVQNMCLHSMYLKGFLQCMSYTVCVNM